MTKHPSQFKVTVPLLKRALLSLSLAGSMVEFSHPLGAAIVLNDTQVLKLSASSTGITRLSVEGDKIQSIFTHPKEFEANLTLHESGHLFILGEEGKGPISVSLVTASGLVQDVSLNFKKGVSKPLILTSLTEAEPKALPQPVSLEKQALEVLSGFIKGSPPKEFMTDREFVGLHEARASQTLTATPLEIWGNSQLTVEIFDVKGPKGEVLDASQFKKPGDLALAFDSKVLRDSFARLYVVREKAKATPLSLRPPFNNPSHS